MMEPFLGPDSKLYFKVLDHDDIASVIDDFASAVVRAREAGVDGCELHAGHGYLIDGFLSPAKNHRTDEYGGPRRAPRPHPGGDPAGDPPASRRRLRGLVPAQLHREPARRHDPRRLHHDRPARAGRRRRRGARVGVPRPGVGDGPDRLVRAAGAGTAHRERARGEGGARRAGDRGRPHHPRRRRRRHRRRCLRLRVDGAHDPRRARAAQPARGREAGGDPAVRVPLPLHRQHLRARSGALRGERLGRSRGRARRSAPRRHRARCWWSAAGRRAWRRHASRRCAATRSRWSTPRRVSADAGPTRPRPPTSTPTCCGGSSTNSSCAASTCALGDRLDADAVVASGADVVVVASGARWGRPALPGVELPHVHGGRRPRYRG